MSAAPRYTRMLELAKLDAAMAQDPSVARTLAINSRSKYNYDALMNRRDRSQIAYQTARNRRDGWLEILCPIFEPNVRRETENNDVANGIQWDEADVSAINDAGVYAHTMNLETTRIRTLMGEHRASQTIFHAVADDQSPENKYAVEFMNNGMQAIADLNNYSSEEQQWFYDGVVPSRGYMQVSRDPLDPEGKILTKRCQPQGFMFDPYSTENGHLAGNKFLFRGRIVNVEDLINQYPEWEHEICHMEWQASARHNLLFTLLNPKIHRSLKDKQSGMTLSHYGNMSKSSFQYLWKSANRTQSLAYTMECYTRHAKMGFEVYDLAANCGFKFETMPQAVSFYKDRRAMYEALMLSQGIDPRLVPAVDPPRTTSIEMIDKEVWCGDILLEYTPTQDTHTPYLQYCPSYRDGEWRGFFEDDKDPQRLLNRMLVQLDINLGGSKSKDVVNMAFLGDMTEEDVDDVMSRPTGTLKIRDLRPEAAAAALHRHEAAQNNNVPQMIMNYAEKAISHQSGGTVSIGVPEFAGQSARQTGMLLRQTSNARVNILAELGDAQRIAGARIAYNLQFLRAGLRLAFVDADKRFKFVKFTEDVIRDMRAIDYVVQVREIIASPTERDRRQAAMIELFGQAPDLIGPALPQILKLSDWEQSDIDEVMAAYQETIDYKRGMEQAELKRKLEESDWNIQFKQITAQLKELELRLSVLPNLNFTGDFNEMGSALQSELLNTAGLDTDEGGLARTRAQKLLMDQDAADLAVVRWFRALPPEAKEKFLAGAASTPRQPETAKDRVNRSIQKSR